MSTKTNLVLDIATFATFIIVSNQKLTGNTIHEWLGVAFAAALIVHLLWHWEWIIKVGGAFFKKMFHQSRLNFVVNLLFFVAMTGSLFSGLLISKSVLATFGIDLGNTVRSWKSIHTLFSDLSLIMLGIHFALHFKWVVTNIGRYIVTPVRSIFQRRSAQNVLAVQPVRMDSKK